MRRSLAIGMVGGCAWLQLACGGGVLGGGGAGSSGGKAGAGGTVVLTGTGGAAAPSGRAGDPFTECSQPLSASRVPPTHVIALDTSLAMNDLPCAGCDTTSRWAGAVEAINAIVGVTQADVSWGLELFGDATNACGTAGDVDVHTALGTSQSIAAELGARTSSDGALTGPSNRATRSAVVAATQHLMRQNSISPQYIVLLTAGTPNCAVGATDPMTDDTAATVDAIRAAFEAGFGTFVVGLGLFDAPTNESLQKMASAGNPGVTDPVPNLYVAPSSSDVQSVLRSLVHFTEGCTFAIPPPPNELANRSKIIVLWGGQSIPLDSTDGWTYTDAGLLTMRFYGKACDAARMDLTQLPVIRYACPLI